MENQVGYLSRGDNSRVFVTQGGIRLIDMGLSVNSNYPDFNEAVADDLADAYAWKEVFLKD